MPRDEGDRLDLFADQSRDKGAGAAPLAERLRPRSFDELVGQEDVVGVDRPLRKAIESDRLASLIFGDRPAAARRRSPP